MPTTSPSDKGYKRYEFRPGIGNFSKWQGVNRNTDPATIPSNALWDAINVRLDHGIIRERGGQTSALDLNETGCIRGIYDFYDATSPEAASMLLFSSGWTHDYNSAAPIRITNTDVSPGDTFEHTYGPVEGPFQVCSYIQKTNNSPPAPVYMMASHARPAAENAVRWGNKLLCFGAQGQGPNTGKVYEVSISEAQDSSQPGTASYNLLFEVGEHISSAVSIKERVIDGSFDQVLDVVFFGTLTAGKVFRYDTYRGLVEEFTGLGTSRMILGAYRGNLVIAYDGVIKYRTALNTISVTVLSAGWVPTAAVEYLDLLYLFGFSAITYDPDIDGGSAATVTPKVISFDGASGTTVNTNAGHYNGVVFDGYLYYGVGSAGYLGVGRFDGSVWNDTYLNATALLTSNQYNWPAEIRVFAFGDASLGIIAQTGGDEDNDQWGAAYVFSYTTNVALGNLGGERMGDDSGGFYGTVVTP